MSPTSKNIALRKFEGHQKSFARKFTYSIIIGKILAKIIINWKENQLTNNRNTPPTYADVHRGN